MKRICSIFLVTILITVIFSPIIKAESVSEFKLVSSSKLKAGDVIELTLSNTELNIDGGIDSIKGTLEYDKSVFEEIPSSETATSDEDYNMQGLNKWKLGIYYSETQIFVLERNSKITNAGDILKIKLKVKSGVTKESTTIRIKDIQLSGGEETGDIDAGAVSCTINQDANSTSENSIITNETVASGLQSSNGAGTTIETLAKDNSVATGILPQTGTTSVIIVMIVVTGIIGVICFVNYKNKHIK